MQKEERDKSVNLEEASQQGNGTGSPALCPTRTSYKGFWIDGCPQQDLGEPG